MKDLCRPTKLSKVHTITDYKLFSLLHFRYYTCASSIEKLKIIAQCQFKFKKYTNNFDLKELKVLHVLIDGGTSFQILGPTYRMDCWLNDILHAIGIILLLFLEPIEYFFIKKISEKAEGSCFM